MVQKTEIDLLIHASVCRDFLEPATASVVHANLSLSKNCMIFDLSNACLGVINAMVIAANMIERGAIKNALIVSGENGGPLLESTIKELLNNPTIDRKNIKKYIANLTIGSAATAIMLTHKSLSPVSPKIIGGAIQTDSSANHLCRGDGNTHELIMQTDSEELLKYGIALASSTWKELCEKIADKSSVTSSRILFPKTAAVSRWLKTLSLPQEIVTYDEFQNTFLDLYEKDGRLDFATRSLQLRPKDAKLFGLSADTPVTIFALLGALPRIFS
jgi:3-oxoacyl-[acyl-carrier-protein] synthase-3